MGALTSWRAMNFSSSVIDSDNVGGGKGFDSFASTVIGGFEAAAGGIGRVQPNTPHVSEIAPIHHRLRIVKNLAESVLRKIAESKPNVMHL